MFKIFEENMLIDFKKPVEVTRSVHSTVVNVTTRLSLPLSLRLLIRHPVRHFLPRYRLRALKVFQRHQTLRRPTTSATVKQYTGNA